MKPANPADPAAQEPCTTSDDELTDADLNAVVGGVGGLVHEDTHATSTSGARSGTGGRCMLDISGHNVGH